MTEPTTSLNQSYVGMTPAPGDTPQVQLFIIFNDLLETLESTELEANKALRTAKNLVFLEYIIDSLKVDFPQNTLAADTLETLRKRLSNAIAQLDKKQLKESLEEACRNIPLNFTAE